MSWIRKGDEWNSAPEWGKAFELALDRNDTRLVNELKGASDSLYTFSAQQWTDYRIRFGEAALVLGHENSIRLLGDLEAIGVIVSVDREQRIYTLLERDNFVHLIRSDEKKKSAKRKRDQNRGSLQVPVLLRDGDNCRYCGVEVVWGDTRSDAGRHMDHRNIEEETTPDNYVVSCRECNQLRFDLGDSADEELPLMDPPEWPVYGQELIKKLSKWPRIVEKVCVQMGIRNPLLGSVEAHKSAPQPAGDTTMFRPDSSHQSSTQPQSLDGSQPSGERLPRDSRKVVARGRAKGAQPRQQSSQAIQHLSNHQSPGQSSSQEGRDPRRGIRSDAPDRQSANETFDPARKRRRRNRRNK